MRDAELGFVPECCAIINGCRALRETFEERCRPPESCAGEMEPVRHQRVFAAGTVGEWIGQAFAEAYFA